jgi:hypothetical protein
VAVFQISVLGLFGNFPFGGQNSLLLRLGEDVCNRWKVIATVIVTVIVIVIILPFLFMTGEAISYNCGIRSNLLAVNMTAVHIRILNYILIAINSRDIYQIC